MKKKIKIPNVLLFSIIKHKAKVKIEIKSDTIDLNTTKYYTNYELLIINLKYKDTDDCHIKKWNIL